jgi:hypothetical protein
MDTSTWLLKEQSPQTDKEREEMKTIPYQSAVGSLIHAAIMSRPDIAHAVQQVAQFMSNPGQVHWTATKRSFRYLRGTRDLILTMGAKTDKVELMGYSDSDFGMSKDHGWSIVGLALLLSGGCFHWSSKKQQAVALSTPEAELYAAVGTGRDIIWMQLFLEELKNRTAFTHHSQNRCQLYN